MEKARIPSAAILALALAACTGEAEETSYEVGATDESGGELIARDPDPEEVQVDLPETAMTPTAPEGVETDGKVETED
ncbi:MAG: hypothetical protein QNJ15_02150 [Erythrobacter sp.]|nr:hypothetical protein [Erythrobacter sp.]